MSRHIALLLAAVGGLTLPVLRAQDDAATKKAPAESAIVLSPFEVRTEKDNGYVASDTAVGGRLSLNLLEMPADTTILTREFLDDIAVNNMTDAYNWMVNTQPLEPANPDFGQNVTIRGLPVAANTRNYIRFDTTVPEFNTERLEEARGPNSILFGDVPSGGAMNTNTKQARFQDFEDVRLRWDTNGSKSALLDMNRQFSDKLAARVNLFAMRGRNWLERYHDNEYGSAADVVYRPWHNTEVHVEGEFDYQAISAVSYIYTDQASAWDQTTAVTGPLKAAPGGGLQRITTDKLVLSPAWNGVLNFLNFAQTTGTGLNLVDDNSRPFLPANFPVLPRRSFQIAPSDSEQKVHPAVASVTVEHIFDNGLVVRLAALTNSIKRERVSAGNGTNYRLDPNKVLPNGDPNPNYGQPYSDSTWGHFYTDQFVDDLQLAMAYPWKTRWFDQTFSVIAERRPQLFKPTNMSLGRSNGTNPDARATANQVWWYRYWNQAEAPFSLPTQGEDGYTFVETKSLERRVRSATNTLQLNTVGHYFHDHLIVVGGIRFDDYTSHERAAATFTPLGETATKKYIDYAIHHRTPAIGFTYFPIHAVGVYANYSEGFLPTFPSGPLVDGLPYNGVFTSTSKTAGLRFRLFGGAVVGSAGYYQSLEKNRLIGQPAILAAVNGIWTDLNEAQNQMAGAIDTQDLHAQGYELDLTTNLWNRLRLKANFSTGHTTQVNTIPGARAYVALHMPEWQAAANDPSQPNRADIQNRLANLANAFSAAAEGRELNGDSKWRANIFGTYLFQNAWLKGLSVGGGANFFGKQLIGNPTANPFDYVWAKEYYIVTGVASYRFKVRKLPVKLSVTVANLLDYSDPVYMTVGTYQGILYRNGYKYIEPRKATFTATIRF